MTGTPRLATAAWLALLPCAAPAQPQVLDLDPAHCFVHFEVLHFGTSTLRGRFGPLAGEVQFDAVAGRGRVGLTIDLNTLDTGLKLLDGRADAAEWLRRLREAALKDEKGDLLDGALKTVASLNG